MFEIGDMVVYQGADKSAYRLETSSRRRRSGLAALRASRRAKTRKRA